MLKKISGLCAGAACLMALCSTAFAQTGVVGNAVGGVVDAGEDIVNGVVNAGDDLVQGVTGGRTGNANGRTGDAAGDVGDLTTPDNGTNNGNGNNAIGDTSDGLITDTTGDGDTAGNPYTGGVTMGYAAISAVVAAMGVTLTSIRRKQD